MKILFHAILLILLFASVAVGQDKKSEVEITISQQEMPDKAISVLQPLLSNANRVGFYRETTNAEISYECKLKWQGKFFSVEFFEDGSLMDIEQLVPFRTLEKDIKKKSRESLQEIFSRFKIRKTQVQYSSKKLADEDIITAVIKENYENLTLRYELVINGKSKESSGTFEILLDEIGGFLKQKEVIRLPLDNVIY